MLCINITDLGFLLLVCLGFLQVQILEQFLYFVLHKSNSDEVSLFLWKQR